VHLRGDGNMLLEICSGKRHSNAACGGTSPCSRVAWVLTA